MESLATLDRLADVLPDAQFRGIYGSTEAGNFVTVSSADDERARPGTIGRPLFGFDAAILGDDDRHLPPGEEGELGLRGRARCSGTGTCPTPQPWRWPTGGCTPATSCAWTTTASCTSSTAPRT